jgi:4-amino-4-deoxy-L-arabinose transferase-like glycosyltransferase
MTGLLPHDIPPRLGRARAVLGVGLTVLAAGWLALAVAAPFFRHSVTSGLSDEYDEIARNLLAHGSYSANLKQPGNATVTRGPIYPLEVALVYRVFGVGNVVAVQFVDLAVHAATAALLVAVLASLAPLGAAALGGLAFGLWPTTLYYAGRGSSETVLLFFLVASLGALLRWRESERLAWAAAAGAALALACLCRGSAVVLLGLALLASLPRLGRPAARAALATLVVAWALVMAPWWVRNSRVAGAFVPFHTLVWYNAYHDDVFDAALAWLDRVGRDRQDWGRLPVDSLPPEVPRHPEGMSYPARLSARDDLIQEARYREIVLRRYAEPGYLASKAARNLRDFWSAAASPWKSRVLGWTSLVWAGLGAVASCVAWRAGRHRGIVLLCVAFVLATWALYLPFLALFRHSLPAAPFIALLLALGAAAVAERRRTAAGSPPPGCAAPRSGTCRAR